MKAGEVAHSVSRGAFYLALEKSVALASGIVYFAFMLRWLGPTGYGIITLALSFAGIATMATGNFEVFLERFAAEYQARNALHVLRRAHWLALGLKVGLGALASLVLALLASRIAGAFEIPELAYLLPILTPIVAFDGLSTTGRATLFGLQRFRVLSLIALSFHVAKVVMVGLMWWHLQSVVVLGLGLSLLAVAQGLVTSAIPLWGLRRVRSPERGEAGGGRPGLLGPMVAYCAPLLGARATFLSGQNLGKIVIGKLFDAAQVGFFSFAFQTVERFIELVHTLPYALLPSLTHLVTRNERERLRDIFAQAHRLIQVAACALSFMLFAFAREITLFVGSPLFEPAVPLVRIMALVPVARTAQQPLTMLFQALHRPGTVLGLAVLKFVTEFGSYFLLIPAAGLIGAGLANLAGAAVSYLVALGILAAALPGGAGERARSVATSIALLVSLLGLVLAVEALPGAALGFTLRLVLVPLGLLGVFGLGLVNRYDLVKLSSVPLGLAGLRRTRDWVVGTADRLARAFESGRTA